MANNHPDVQALVATALAEGWPPAEIERAVVRALRVQAAPYWEQNGAGDWYEPRVCAACGLRQIGGGCPKGKCSSDKRHEVTLREWIGGGSETRAESVTRGEAQGRMAI